MVQRFRRQIAVLCFGLLTAVALSAHEQAQPISGALPPEGEPVSPWLDEVRAQRRAREERRRATKEAIDARRRWIDPWGAAQHEAREQEVQRRRDAFLEKIEREREAFRNQAPWTPPQTPWPEEIAAPALETPAPVEAETAGSPEPSVQQPPPYAPHGWNNHWYYRGY